MKPNFALNLSHDGIVLLHRSPRGTWTDVGEVALDDTELRENLSFLRSTAVGLEGKGFGTKLVLPHSQILFTDVDAPGPSEAERLAQIVRELEGQTPYSVTELTFDWIEFEGRVRVAVVANETLDEAEMFAVEHRFNPISFTSEPEIATDGWEPFFGRTDFSIAFLGADADVREAPIPAPEPTNSLFLSETSDGDEENPAELASQNEDDESFFEPPPQAAGNANIFIPSEGQEDPASEHGVSNQPVPDVSNPAIPAFSSRRQGQQSSPIPEDERPLGRVAPRIAIAGAAETKPATADTPEIFAARADADIDRSQPHSSTTANDEKTNSKISAWLSKLAVLALLMWRAFLVLLRHAKSLGQKLITSLGPLIASGFTRLSASIKNRKSKPSPAAKEPALRKPASGKRKAAAYSALAALIILGLLGLYFSFSPSDPAQTTSGIGDIEAQNTAFSTTSPERGVRQDNRPRSRPTDLAIENASLNPGQTTEILPIRPERRSVFEGQIDPDAELPDTAKPITALSEQQLADIRAAGLQAPTVEEIAEGNEGSHPDQLDAAELAAAYQATGILQGLKTPPRPNINLERDDIFVAALDRHIQANDAIILPDFNTGVQDHPPKERLSPLAPGTVFDLDERGFVKPTENGALNPDGILVHLGKPPVIPPTKPETEALVPPNPLLALKPKARPAELKTGEDAVFIQGRLTIAQLRVRKPKSRPESEQTALATEGNSPSELAVLTSFQPAKRPSDFDKTVKDTLVKIAATAPTAGTTPGPALHTGPVLPTRANVAKTATIPNAINLAKINLIGVYGTPSTREAMLRLPSGRFVKVKIGDRIDGGRVAAIGADSISYVKSGRNRVLKIPN